jgi:pantothenate kinase
MLSVADIDSLLGRIIKLEENDKLVMIGIAGIAGSGKSTIAKRLCTLLNAKESQSCVVVGMDGFHYSKSQLRELFPRDLHSVEEAFRRRGAPFTFDGEAFVQLIESIRTGSKFPILAPAFDHSTGDPVQDIVEIHKNIKVVIVEGLYLALDYSPWNRISVFLDELWWLKIDIKLAEERLAKRHVASGICKSLEEAYSRIIDNDRINGEHIMKHSSNAKMTIVNCE